MDRTHVKLSSVAPQSNALLRHVAFLPIKSSTNTFYAPEKSHQTSQLLLVTTTLKGHQVTVDKLSLNHFTYDDHFTLSSDHSQPFLLWSNPYFSPLTVTGQKISGQNIPHKIYRTKRTRPKYNRQYISDKIYRPTYTRQIYLTKGKTFADQLNVHMPEIAICCCDGIDAERKECISGANSNSKWRRNRYLLCFKRVLNIHFYCFAFSTVYSWLLLLSISEILEHRYIVFYIKFKKKMNWN